MTFLRLPTEQNMTTYRLIIYCLSILSALATQAIADSLPSHGIYDVRAFGAVGDGVTLDTKAIQKAIDTCAEAGGGEVYLQGGTFLSGTIRLKSNVTLQVEAGATLLGSTNIADYPDITPDIIYLYRARFTKYLIYAEKAENIGLAGRGYH